MNPKIQKAIAALYEQGLNSGVESLEGWRRQVYLLVEVETYLGMEGFEGFFHSPLAAYAGEVVGALSAIGAEQSAELFQRATILFRSSQSRGESLDSPAASEFSDFDAVGRAFSESTDHRSQLMEDYVLRMQSD